MFNIEIEEVIKEIEAYGFETSEVYTGTKIEEYNVYDLKENLGEHIVRVWRLTDMSNSNPIIYVQRWNYSTVSGYLHDLNTQHYLTEDWKMEIFKLMNMGIKNERKNERL